MNTKSRPVAILYGMLGGSIVVVVAVAVLAVVGLPGLSTRIVVHLEKEPKMMAHAISRLHTSTAGKIYMSDAPGVVFVRAIGVSESQSSSEFIRGESVREGIATGSGFELDKKGTILTNWHVVENSRKVMVSLGPGKSLEAKTVGEDASHDLAVLRIPTKGLKLHPLALGDSSKVQVGDPVLTIGNPFGLERTLTTGVVSALQRQIIAPDGVTIEHILQTDAPINPGNSGGPLLNDEGQVIGIASQILTSGNHGGNVGIAFAIPIDAAKMELSRL